MYNIKYNGIRRRVKGLLLSKYIEKEIVINISPIAISLKFKIIFSGIISKYVIIHVRVSNKKDIKW